MDIGDKIQQLKTGSNFTFFQSAECQSYGVAIQLVSRHKIHYFEPPELLNNDST